MKLQTLLAAGVLVGSVTAHAAEPQGTLQQQIERMQKMIEQQQQQLQQQQLQLQELQQTLQQQAAAAAPRERELAALQQLSQREQLVEQEAPRLTVTNSRPTITSADGRNSLSVRANVQLDAGRHADGDEGPLNSDFRRGSIGGAGNRETNAARDFSDGAYFRRARFGIEGAIARDFNYRLLLELGGSGTEGPTRVNDAWINYTGFAPFIIQFGAFSPPANMDDGTTPEDLLFIERASAAELSRTLGGADGRLGLGLRGSGTRWFGALTLTSRTVNDAEVFDSQTAAVGRFGVLAATSANYNVHLGLSGTYVLSPPDQGSSAAPPRRAIRLRDRPEIRIDGTRLIDTGAIDAAHAEAFGVEFGANYRNFYLQAENFWFGVDRRNSLTAVDFDGYYLQGSWVLTGESRRYNVASGSFQNSRPFVPVSFAARGIGAFELAARFSHVDLNDAAGRAGVAALADAIRGGEQDIFTLGLNWYLNANFKLLLNYLDISVDRLNPMGVGNLTPFGAAPATPPPGVEIGQDLEVYALRAQYSF